MWLLALWFSRELGVIIADIYRFANEESLQDIYRVLAPGGSLGLIWNIEDCE